MMACWKQIIDNAKRSCIFSKNISIGNKNKNDNFKETLYSLSSGRFKIANTRLLLTDMAKTFAMQYTKEAKK